MTNIHPDLLKQLKEYYKPGTRIRLVRMNDPFTHIPPGTIGVVSWVDDAGTVFATWSNGCTLGIGFNEDYAEIIEEVDHE